MDAFLGNFIGHEAVFHPVGGNTLEREEVAFQTLVVPVVKEQLGLRFDVLFSVKANAVIPAHDFHLCVAVRLLVVIGKLEGRTEGGREGCVLVKRQLRSNRN